MYKTLDYFENMMENDATCQYDGFMFHEGLGYGKMITTYPDGCMSPKNESWPLFLREQPGRKGMTSFLGVQNLKMILLTKMALLV